MRSRPYRQTASGLAFAALIVTLTACSTTYDQRIRKAHDAATVGNYSGGIEVMNGVLGVGSEEKLPEKWTANRPLGALERGMLLQAKGEYALSSRDISGADTELEFLDLELDTAGNIGKYVYSDSSTIYKTTPTEKMALNAFNMLNFLALGRLDAAAVEARRLTVIRDYLEENDQESHSAFGSYLGGFVFEQMGGEDERAMRYYGDTLDDLPDLGPLGPGVARLARKTSYRSEPINTFLASPAATAPSGPTDAESGEILVVTGIGRVPHKEAEVMPIGLAIGYASAFITGDTKVLERSAFKVVKFPELRPSRSVLRRASVTIDGSSVPVHLMTDLGAEIKREHEELKPKIIGAALTRMIARAIAAEGARHAGKRANPLVGILAALATEAALVGLDTPDTRSWSFLPERVYMSRLRVPPGDHKVTVTLNGAGVERRETTLRVEPGSFAVFVATAPR